MIGLKNFDLVSHFIEENCSTEEIIVSVNEGSVPGITAAMVQERLGIVRNNASTILNQLWKENHLIKVNSRPVCFFAVTVLHQLQRDYVIKYKNNYTMVELREALQSRQTPVDDPFLHLLGSKGSLTNQIGQAKAAIVYPPKGLHTLILGESGVGKTTFASAMHAYGLRSQNKTPDEFPFVAFNCADYFNNPQLLLSQLFGHVKHAFTGAERDRAGLVEKADGGILFLDEIHRLPPDGQEMLFYLMDKGEYSRLGESSAKRTSKVLIIAATTEEPNGTLLATFIRRIPVTITLPTFAEKPISERVETVDYFFHYEAMNLNKQINLAPEVLRALSTYDFKIGNIGQLRSEIKLLCAKAFLQHLQNNQILSVDFPMLAKEIRESLFDYTRLDNSTKNYLNMFSENIVISPLKEQEYFPFAIKDDLYERIIQKLDTFKTQGLSEHAINDLLKKEVDDYFVEIMKNFHTARVNIHTLYKLIPKEIVDATAELIDFAQHHLATKFNTKFIFGLSFHIHGLLKRIRSGKSIQNQHLSEIKRDHAKEFRIAKALVGKLSEKFNVAIPNDEQGFLALLLAHNQMKSASMDKIGIIIICHGNTTASSIADVVNSLLNTDWVKAIDMPLHIDIPETYNKVRSLALALHRNRGVILLTDMGSLLEFGTKLMEDTGIKTKVIDSVSTPIALEVLRNVLYKTDDLDALYQTIIAKPENFPETAAAKCPAILSVCITGQGTSKMTEQIIKNLLKSHNYEQVKIIVVNYLDAKKNLPLYRKTYHLLAVIGNIDPGINLPYFSIAKLVSQDFQKEFLHLLDSSFHPCIPAFPSAKSIYEKAKDLLEQYVKFINPKVAVTHIKKVIEQIGYAPENRNLMLDLIVHMGCMLDRCMHHDAILFENVQAFKKQYPHEFELIRSAIDQLEKEYDIKINDDEVCYIIKIIKIRT